MPNLTLRENCLGLEVLDEGRLAALLRVREELPREESPKPCFAPIYTPAGALVTEYRPKDHLWHTGLYYGWVHVNDSNLWGGPWYIPREDGGEDKYVLEPGTHGVQRHDAFEELCYGEAGVRIVERVTWLDRNDQPLAADLRRFEIRKQEEPTYYAWRIESGISPLVDRVVMGASRAARYSGLELRMGPPFADADHRCSEGRQGHEAIMGQRARWVCAVGSQGGAVVMMDHPDNPRHPVTWFTRRNLLGAGLLMSGDLELERGDTLRLRYGFYVFAEAPADETIEQCYEEFASA